MSESERGRPGLRGDACQFLFRVSVLQSWRGRPGIWDAVLGPSVEGELALGAGWPAMFHTYVGEAPHYRARFADG